MKEKSKDAIVILGLAICFPIIFLISILADFAAIIIKGEPCWKSKH